MALWVCSRWGSYRHRLATNPAPISISAARSGRLPAKLRAVSRTAPPASRYAAVLVQAIHLTAGTGTAAWHRRAQQDSRSHLGTVRRPAPSSASVARDLILIMRNSCQLAGTDSYVYSSLDV